MKKKLNILFFSLCFLAALLLEAYFIQTAEEDWFSLAAVGVVVLITGYLLMDSIRCQITKSLDNTKFFFDHLYKEETGKWNERYIEFSNLQKATYTATKKTSVMLTEQFEQILNRIEAIETNNTKALQKITELQKKALEGQKNALNLEVNYNKENTRLLIHAIKEDNHQEDHLELLARILHGIELNNTLLKEQLNQNNVSQSQVPMPNMEWEAAATLETEPMDYIFEDQLEESDEFNDLTAIGETEEFDDFNTADETNEFNQLNAAEETDEVNDINTVEETEKFNSINAVEEVKEFNDINIAEEIIERSDINIVEELARRNDINTVEETEGAGELYYEQEELEEKGFDSSEELDQLLSFEQIRNENDQQSITEEDQVQESPSEYIFEGFDLSSLYQSEISTNTESMDEINTASAIEQPIDAGKDTITDAEQVTKEQTIIPLYDDPNKALTKEEIATLFASYGQ